MTKQTLPTCALLPEPAARALQETQSITDPRARQIAREKATARIKTQYPQFFRKES
jgi:hypothetical protein